MTRVVDLSTYLEAPPEKVWSAVKKPSTFAYVTKGLMDAAVLTGSSLEGMPDEDWAQAGRKIELKLKALSAIPLWRHTIEIQSVDEQNRTIQTSERGGAVKSWRHRITVEPEGTGSRYRDRVEIEAGVATPAVHALALMLYRYRQARWRELARTL